MNLKKIVEEQRTFYLEGNTKPLSFRKKMLEILRDSLKLYEDKLKEAFVLDLGKCKEEAELTEFMMATHEIEYAIKNMKKWTKTRRVHTPITCAFGISKVHREPYGVSLILSPWNYPLLLAMGPLIGSISGGNCAVLKCSKSSVHVSTVMKEMMDHAFPKEFVYCAEIGCPYEEILEPIYDYIFFTGSKSIGKVIMAKAAENLTPVSLELGGKSPCIVEKSADISYSARRIVWGKFMNGGQTCIAPDYIFAEESIKEELIEEIKKQIVEMYPNPLMDSDYPSIINERHFNRLCNLIDAEEQVICGGRDAEKRRIFPTILPDATFQSPVMQEEIFGPILPIITYQSRDEIVSYLQGEDKPLAFYLFTKNRESIKKYMDQISFGGGCVNDVIMHMANENLPFGGVGASGMGAYHGKYNFETFSREKGVLYKNTKLEMKAVYRPFTERKQALLKFLIGK